MGAAALAGIVALAPFCYLHAWTLSTLDGSNKDGRPIDHWNTSWLRVIYDNPEDGVSGQQALIWNSTGTALMPYLPKASTAWRAYRWSAIRNSADGLKYLFAWKEGPLKTFTLFGRTHKIGWQGGLPVFS